MVYFICLKKVLFGPSDVYEQFIDVIGGSATAKLPIISEFRFDLLKYFTISLVHLHLKLVWTD